MGHRDEGPWGDPAPIPVPGPVRNFTAAEAPTKHNGESKFGSLSEAPDLLRNLGLDFAPPPSYCTSDRDAAEGERKVYPDQ